MHTFVVLGLVLFHAKPGDRLGQTSPKRLILCRVGHKTTTQSITSVGVYAMTDMRPGHCYRRLDESRDRCDQSLASNLTRRQCCCSIGRGWHVAATHDHQRPRPHSGDCRPCPHAGTCTYFAWRGVVVSGVRRINEVNARRARLVPGWVTVFGQVYHLGM